MAARLRDYELTRLRDYEVTRLRGGEVASIRRCEASGFRSHEIPKGRSYGVARVRTYENEGRIEVERVVATDESSPTRVRGYEVTRFVGSGFLAWRAGDKRAGRHHGGMTSGPWPREPSPTFALWRGELYEWREAHAPSGRHFQVTAANSAQLYYAHGGVDEVGTVADLTWIARTGKQIKGSQQVVWDVHAHEVLEAAREGGIEATAEALRESNEWIRRLASDGQPVKEGNDAARWASGVMGTCPPNPMIRAEEVWGLWESLAAARRTCEGLRDRLLLELEDEGFPRTRMADGLGWSYSRLWRRLVRLEDERADRVQRARQGEVPGVIDLESRRPGSRGRQG